MKKSSLILLSCLGLLAACGEGVPGKDEIKKAEVERAATSDATNIFTGQTDAAKKQQLIEQYTKSIDVQSVNCKPTQGFDNVWDCSVSQFVNGDPGTIDVRVTREKDGSLNVQ